VKAAALTLVVLGIVASAWPVAAQQPVEPPAAPKRRPPTPPLGLRVVALDAAAARALNIAGGVSVEHATGLAYESGLRQADVIVDVNGRAVSSADEFWDAVAAENWQPTLRVLRQGQPLSIRFVAGEPRS
jgi:serine protease Do